MREELFDEWRRSYGVFFTESDSGPIAIFRREKDAIKYAENHNVPDVEKGYHLKHGNICILKCDVSGSFWNSFEDETVPKNMVHAEPIDGTDGYLVTLECGHKIATRKKQVSYPCRECLVD